MLQWGLAVCDVQLLHKCSWCQESRLCKTQQALQHCWVAALGVVSLQCQGSLLCEGFLVCSAAAVHWDWTFTSVCVVWSLYAPVQSAWRVVMPAWFVASGRESRTMLSPVFCKLLCLCKTVVVAGVTDTVVLVGNVQVGCLQIWLAA